MLYHPVQNGGTVWEDHRLVGVENFPGGVTTKYR